MDLIVIDNAYEPHKRKMTSTLIKLLRDLWPSVKVVETPQDLYALDHNKVGGYILSGSHHRLSIKSATSLPTLFLNLAALASTKPVLGICFGFQLMSWVEGVPVLQRPCPSKGLFPTVIPHLGQTLLLHYHCCDKPSTIPPSFHLLGTRTDSQEQEGVFVKHKTKPWTGVLFHPEVSGKFGKRLLKEWIDSFALTSNKI